MEKHIYKKLINESGKYIEHVILPELLVFVFIRMYINNIKFEHSFYYYFNYYRRIFNVKNINYRIVFSITKNILLKRYGLLTISINPLILKKIKES